MIGHRSDDFFNSVFQNGSCTRLTWAAKQAIANARDEADCWHDTAIDTHHLLLGLMMNRADLVAQVLRSRGVTLDRVRGQIEQLIPQSRERNLNSSFPPKIKQPFQTALTIAIEMGHSTIDTGHLFLGLIRPSHQEDNKAICILTSLNVDLQLLDRQIQEHLIDQQLASKNGIYLNPAAGTLASYYPADMMAGEIAACLTAWLVCWVDPYKLGRVFINTGLQLANQDIQAVGISFISKDRLKYSANYLEIAPDLVIEIKSTGESLISLQATIENAIELGTRVGILINPEEKTVTLYRPNDDIFILTNREILIVNEVFPGWKLPVSSLWICE